MPSSPEYRKLANQRLVDLQEGASEALQSAYYRAFEIFLIDDKIIADLEKALYLYRKVVEHNETHNAMGSKLSPDSDDREQNPPRKLKNEEMLLKILNQTQHVGKKVQSHLLEHMTLAEARRRRPDIDDKGYFITLDTYATLARGLKNYEEAVGRQPTKAEIKRADRFFRLGEYDY
jgi:hypothetical protein